MNFPVACNYNKRKKMSPSSYSERNNKINTKKKIITIKKNPKINEKKKKKKIGKPKKNLKFKDRKLSSFVCTRGTSAECTSLLLTRRT